MEAITPVLIEGSSQIHFCRAARSSGYGVVLCDPKKQVIKQLKLQEVWQLVTDVPEASSVCPACALTLALHFNEISGNVCTILENVESITDELKTLNGK